MIIWTSKVTERETEPAWKDAPLRRWRWVIEIDCWSISLNSQIQFGDAEWRLASSYYSLNVTKHWSFGQDHIYYDGPHCSISFGPIHYNWSGAWCTKCMPDR